MYPSGAGLDKINLRIPPPVCSLDKVDQPAETCSSSMADHVEKMCFPSWNDCNSVVVTVKNRINLVDKNE